MTRPITTPPTDRDVARTRAPAVRADNRTHEFEPPLSLEAAIARADALFASMQTPAGKAAAKAAGEAIRALPRPPGYVVHRKP